jgi:hypothetical protein
MLIDDVSLQLQIIEKALEDIPLTLEDNGVSVAMFNLGSVVTALKMLIDEILTEDFEGEVEKI